MLSLSPNTIILVIIVNILMVHMDTSHMEPMEALEALVHTTHVGDAKLNPLLKPNPRPKVGLQQDLLQPHMVMHQNPFVT